MASTSQLKRMSTRSQPRTTRYRYVVNDLPPPPPPVLPPPDSELTPVPPVIRPARPARSGSRPTPTPSRAASPVPVTLPLNVSSAGPKQTRRRSRSLGSLPPPPPYAVEDSPASARGSAVTVTADPAVVLDLKDKSMRTLRRMSRSLTQLRSRGQSSERGPPPSTAQKPLVTVIPPVPVRAQTTDRGPPPSSAYKPLVTVIPPMPDRAPPLPSDEPTSSTTPIARPVPSSKAEASLGRAPPTIRNTGAAAPPDQMANPRPAPKIPSTNIDPPMPLAARDDSAVREQVQGIKLRRISRSYTNLRLMATPDALQAEQQTNRALQLQADKDAQLNRARSLSPRPLPTLPQQNKEQVTPSTSSQGAKAAPAQPARRVLPAPPSTPPSGPLPTPPPPPPAPASVGEQPTPASRKGRGILATSAARLKAMSPMAMMSSFAPSRPSSRDSTSSRTTTASSHSHSHSYSSHTTASVSSHTTASSSSHSHSHSYSHSPSSRAPPLAPFANVNRSRSGSAASASRLVIPIPRMRSRALPPPEVYTPVDPVVAPNNRISFLKPAMVKPYMGQRF